MADQTQILVLESEQLLAASVLGLLATRPELEVTHTTVGSLACVDQAESLTPDVVILDEALLAANLSAVIKLADRHPKIRLIVLGLEDNRLHIFDKHMLQVRHVSDFLDVL